jgi:hypothetical protein
LFYWLYFLLGCGMIVDHLNQICHSYSFKNINDLLMVPIKSIGQSRKLIKSKLGPWVSLETKAIASEYVNGLDKAYTIKYDGLILGIYEVAKSKKEMLIFVKMTKNYPQILPELIGLKKEMVESSVKQKMHLNGGVYRYSAHDDIGENSIICKFKNDVLIEIEWSYYVD